MKTDYKKVFAVCSSLAAGILSYKLYQNQIAKRRFQQFKLNVKQNFSNAQHILILGDSVARGCGSTNGGFGSHLVNLLQEGTNKSYELTNLGIDGLTSSGLVDIINEKETRESIIRSDIIILNIGGNDLLEHFVSGGPIKVIKEFSGTRKTFKKNLLYIKETIHTINPNAVLIANGLYNPCEESYEYFLVAERLIRLWNKTLKCLDCVTVNTCELSKDRSYWEDDVHPNDEGYRNLANIIYRELTIFI